MARNGEGIISGKRRNNDDGKANECCTRRPRLVEMHQQRQLSSQVEALGDEKGQRTKQRGVVSLSPLMAF